LSYWLGVSIELWRKTGDYNAEGEGMGGKVGNDQFYDGIGHDVMIGGRGANCFDCGLNGNAIILNFMLKDTKAPNCEFVITVPPGVPVPPPLEIAVAQS